jgi:hypothetical protein
VGVRDVAVERAARIGIGDVEALAAPAEKAAHRADTVADRLGQPDREVERQSAGLFQSGTTGRPSSIRSLFSMSFITAA